VTPIILAVGGRVAPEDRRGIPVADVGPGDVTAATRRAIEDGHDRIGVAGVDADAAAVAMAAAASGRRVAMAILGRSDLHSTFALADREDMGRLIEGRRYPIDLGIVEGPWGRRPFINTVSSGITASPLGLAVWTPGRRGRVVVETDRTLTRDGVIGLLVMNGQSWSGLTVAPRATLVDGALEVQLLACPRWRIPALRAAMRHGLHVSWRDVARRRVTVGRVVTPARWWLAADGRRVGRGSFDLSVLSGAVDLLI
jgi:hypothetical protein